jgi:FKBP-type peptidyl-prolyl cis-trans isomerase FklB
MNLADRLFRMKNEKAEANLQAGQEFLAANKTKAGVTELPSGLQYEILTEGNGPKPTQYNTVTCHYHGTLIDGTVFDSSVKRGQPASFPLNMVIKGWTEGLQLMGTGSKWRFFIPPHLGYGDRQVGPTIGPNSTLIFDVELISIN